MRLLLVNPNVTEAVTRRMADEARAAASSGTEVAAVTAPFGTAYVENRVEAAVAAHAVLEVLAAHADGHDAAIVAAFGDPGLAAARELLEVPVVGLEESALVAAWMLARRFTILCMTPRLALWYRETAREHGLDARLAAVRPLEEPVGDLSAAARTLAEPLLALALRSVEEDGAEAIVVGGGPLAGVARAVAERVPVPVLDGVACAVRAAEMLAGLGVRPARRGGFARPAPKLARGLGPGLAARIGLPGGDRAP